MAKNYEVKGSVDDAKMIGNAIARAVKDLEKLEAAVLNAGVKDAATPVHAEIKRMKALQEQFEQIYQPRMKFDMLPKDAQE